MKKVIIIIVVLVGLIFVGIIGRKLYFEYQWNKYKKELEFNSYSLNSLIRAGAESDEIKTNDLIFVCELRKALWTTGVEVDVIQKIAENNNSKYKEFVNKLKTKINKDEVLNKYVNDDSSGSNSLLVGHLCTLKKDFNWNVSLYSDLLGRKYNLTNSQDSIGYVDMSKISQEDLDEYRKALRVEEHLRLQF